MISDHTGEGMSGLTVCVRERQREVAMEIR